MNGSLIGKSIQRIDVKDKVTGKALYPGDFNRPDQLYLKAVFAGRPHAVVKKVDTLEAEALDGVIMVLTSKDVPCNEYGLMEKDQPVLCGPGSDIPYSDHVRFVGDQVALVVAESEEIAYRASKLVKVDFEDLPIVPTIEDAMEKDAVLLHPEKGSNDLCHFQIRYGDIRKGFEQADIVIESEYHTPVQEHVFLQPEAGISYLDDEGRVTIVVAGQWIHEDREQVAHALKLPEEKVRIIYPAIGGAFGGREDMSVQIILGLAVIKLHEAGIDRPVKIVWSREESLIGHHKRHAYKINTKWGVSRQGKITAVEADIISDAGAYMYTSNKVLANSTLMITGPYYVPNAKIDSKAVCTNTIPGGAFRGFGGPQSCFATEMQMDKLAEALDMDPLEFRLLNTIKEDEELPVGTPLPKGISIDHVLKTCAEAAGWKNSAGKWAAPDLRDKNQGDILHGIGISAGYKNIGFSFGAVETCWAGVSITGNGEIEKVTLRHAGADVGQGAHSLFVQLAADIIGVPLEKVELVASDTAITGNSGSASASRMTFMAGNAIIGAAREAKVKWDKEDRPVEVEYVYRAPATTPYDPETGACMPNFCYGYAANAVEVTVNTKTGKVLIHKVVCSDDVGKAINPQQVRGQIEGAIVQACGYTLIEDFIQENGQVKTNSLATYLVPTIMDIPDEMESIIIEDTDPIGPMGARGVGEIPYMSLSPAVLCAVHNATGVWFDRFTLTEERVLEGLGALRKGR